MIKNQDIVLLAVLMGRDADKLTYAQLGKSAAISVSEAYGGTKRLQEISLINGDRRPIRRNVLEFMTHALKYTFPMRNLGRTVKGMPTSYAAPVASDEFSASGDVPVWQSSDGTVLGRAFEPIYHTAPVAASQDSEVYAKLAVFDMLRGGRIRERLFAVKKLEEMMS